MEIYPKSVIWKFFKFVGKANAPDKTKTVCSLCLDSNDVKKKGKMIPYNNGTTNMKAHLERYHKTELREAEEKMMEESSSKSGVARAQPLITDFSQTSATAKKWNKAGNKWKTATKLISEWVVSDSRPLTIVEDPGFKKVIEFLCPEFDVPSRKTIGVNIESQTRPCYCGLKN